MPIGKKKHGKAQILLLLMFYLISFSWVRFEEIAENVLGRWSKPHVATLMQTALLDLKNLISSGIILLNVQPIDLAFLSRKSNLCIKVRFIALLSL